MSGTQGAIDQAQKSQMQSGIAYATIAYLIYGAMPIYMKQLQAVPTGQIMAHRVIWSVVLLAIIVSLLRRWDTLRQTISLRLVGLFAVTALLIGTNWLVYIWAVLQNHVLETSLGFFVTPLMTVLLGVVGLGERLNRLQAIAVGLAALGVLVFAIGQGGSLWIAMALAVTFSTAGLIRKIVPLDPLCGLLIETSLLAPMAIAWLWLASYHGQPVFGTDAVDNVFLVLTGVVTAVPLLLFSIAAKKMPYSLAGQFQYIGPSLQFLQAVLLFQEPFGVLHVFTFGCIWVGLAFFIFDALRGRRV
jgi:chloramphenicol-sensitive protein RarD